MKNKIQNQVKMNNLKNNQKNQILMKMNNVQMKNNQNLMKMNNIQIQVMKRT